MNKQINDAIRIKDVLEGKKISLTTWNLANGLGLNHKDVIYAVYESFVNKTMKFSVEFITIPGKGDGARLTRGVLLELYFEDHDFFKGLPSTMISEVKNAK